MLPGRCRLRTAVSLWALLQGVAAAAGWCQTRPTIALAPAPVSAPPRVSAIEIRSDGPLIRAQDLRSFLAVAPGEPLSDRALRRTLRNLHASGVASRIEISTRPEPEGVVVVVSIWPSIQVDEVRLEGDFGVFRRRELQALLSLQEGGPLLESRVLQDTFRLEDHLNDGGYLQARVKLDVRVDDAARKAEITYSIEPGPRTQVGSISFEGDPGPWTPAQLIEQLHGRPGQPYRRRVGREDAETLQRWMISQGHRLAVVGAPREILDLEMARADLVFPVDSGPKVVTEIEGAELDKLRKKGLLPFLEEGGYDDALVLAAVERIRAYYQRQGRYFVQVSSREEATSEGGRPVRRVILGVQPGEVYSLEEIRFDGNREVSDEELASLMETSAGGLLGLGGGRLVTEVLEADLDNIRSFYTLHGYLGSRVGPERLEVRGRDLFLTLPIHEGERQVVTAIEFHGVEALSPTALKEVFLLAEGEGFHPSLLEDSLDALRSRYAELGFNDALISASPRWNPERTEVSIEVQVLEGGRQTLDRIIVTGNTRTETPVVLHALGARSGDPISGTRLLDMERNLYRLGIFSRVDVELVPGDIGATRRDVVVKVVEGKTRTLLYGLGWDSDDGARGLVGFSQRNAFGHAYTFRSDLRVSQKDRRLRLFFEQPWIPGWPVGMAYELYRVEEDRESYAVTRWVLPRIEARLGGRRRFSVFLDYRRLETDGFVDALLEPTGEVDAQGRPVRSFRPGVLSPLEEQDGETAAVWIASLTPGFYLDRRDDPLEPTRGWSTSAQLQTTFPAAQAEAGYFKLFVQHRHFFSLGRLGVLAAGLRLGAIEPWKEVPGSAEDPALAVPLDERFFAGGRSTHRAFRRFLLGIPEETLLVDERTRSPIGGNGLVLLNLELRFPIVEALGGVVFFDSGNVWRDWRDFDLGGSRHGVGVGLRYLSPIGPLRLDGAWKLDRLPGESGFELHFSFGNPF